jgi:hypothetical protein
VTDQRTKPGGELFGAERVCNVRFHAVRSEDRRNPSGVDQDVVVALVVTAPDPSSLRTKVVISAQIGALTESSTG